MDGKDSAFFGGLVIGFVFGAFFIFLYVAITFTPNAFLCRGIHDTYELETVLVNDECFVQVEVGEELIPADEFIVFPK